MPELKWDETDFLECLEVIPQIEEYGTEHYYEVKKNGLILAVSVWQYESVIALSLLQEAGRIPITSFALVVRDRVRYIHDKRGEYLEFNDCVVVSNRFFGQETRKDIFDKTKFSDNLRLEISIKPNLQIKFQ